MSGCEMPVPPQQCLSSEGLSWRSRVPSGRGKGGCPLASAGPSDLKGCTAAQGQAAAGSFRVAFTFQPWEERSLSPVSAAFLGDGGLSECRGLCLFSNPQNALRRPGASPTVRTYGC